MDKKYAIGLDYLDDSARAIVIDAATGRVAAKSAKPCPRRQQGKPNGIFFLLASDISGRPEQMVGDNLAKGVCGQIDGLDIPDMLGLEASQAVFGDVFAWLRRLLSFPLAHIVMESQAIDEEAKAELVAEAQAKIIPALTAEAERIAPEESAVVAAVWASQARQGQPSRGVVVGISQSTTAPVLFRALVEATAFGTRSIVERMRREGVGIDGVIGIGDIALKSPFAMQVLADVLRIPIKACPASAAPMAKEVFEATAEHPGIGKALAAIASTCVREFRPNEAVAEIYDRLYGKYARLCALQSAAEGL